jgi:methylated-DNA-[protein]-cysteine S-methyltransferase
MRLQLERWKSPMTTLLLVTDDEGMLRALDFAEKEDRMHRLLRLHYGQYTLRSGSIPASVKKALRAYFDGNIDALDEIQVATKGTLFQRKVWKALRDIPSGTTISYGTLATHVGHPSASRAVGAANGANPIGIVVPCHRVIGASGKLTGYAGGLSHKQWLLDHERRYARIPA